MAPEQQSNQREDKSTQKTEAADSRRTSPFCPSKSSADCATSMKSASARSTTVFKKFSSFLLCVDVLSKSGCPTAPDDLFTRPGNTNGAA